MADVNPWRLSALMLKRLGVVGQSYPRVAKRAVLGGRFVTAIASLRAVD